MSPAIFRFNGPFQLVNILLQPVHGFFRRRRIFDHPVQVFPEGRDQEQFPGVEHDGRGLGTEKQHADRTAHDGIGGRHGPAADGIDGARRQHDGLIGFG